MIKIKGLYPKVRIARWDFWRKKGTLGNKEWGERDRGREREIEIQLSAPGLERGASSSLRKVSPFLYSVN